MPLHQLSRQGVLARTLFLLALTAAYFVAGKFGLLFGIVHASASPVWPPTGIAIAAALLFGARVWPAVLAGAFLVNVTTAGSVATSLGIAVGNTLEALSAGYLVDRFANGARAFERARDIFAFAVLAGFASTAVSATVGVASLTLGGYASYEDAPRIWWTWWLGDLAGALVVAPALVLAVRTRPLGFRGRTLEAGLVMACTLLVGLVAFGPLGTGRSLSFLCLPPLAWTAFRLRPREVAASVVTLSGVAVWGTSNGLGTFARGSPNESLLLLEAFMATIATTMLPVSALVAEARRIAREREEARAATEGERARLHAVLRHIPAAVLIVEAPSGRVLLGNEQAQRILGKVFVPGELLGAGGLTRAFHPDGRPYDPSEWPIHRALVAGAAPIEDHDGNRIAAVVVFADVTERKRILSEREELLERERALRSQAEATSRAKDEFLALLSHELRTPLAAITSAVHLLENPQRDAEGLAPANAILARQVRHLARLVDDLLDLARVTSGSVVLKRRPTDLAETVADSVAGLRLAGQLDRHEVALDVHTAWVDGDPERLQQVVTNLLANAIKYTPPGGHLRVSTEREGSEAVLHVDDDGVGIPSDKLPHVFDPFFQGDGTIDRRQGGLGLGLTLVRRLVVLHGGTVHAGSPGRGHGAVFAVRLPAMEAPDKGEREKPAIRPAPAHGPARILLVEDNEDARESLRLVLERAGHVVTCATDGPTGVQAFLRSRPDVALVDVGLPGFDGYEVARRIRSGPAGSGILLVALTGYGQPHDRREAEDAGFDLHVVKPVEPHHLFELLATSARQRDKAPLGVPRGDPES
jgi:signal transduction histidine kinase/ActR/RegA family two-component response regulator